jgi:hypothetical protein
MFRTTRQNVSHPILATLGAFAASALCLGVAAAPAHAGDDEGRAWTARVSNSLESQLRVQPAVPAAVRAQKAAVIGAHFNRDGVLYATSLVVPTGNRILDDEALRAVNAIRFPPLPAAMRGDVRVVPIEVFFGAPDAHRNAAQVRRTALDLPRRIQQYQAVVPADQPHS